MTQAAASERELPDLLPALLEFTNEALLALDGAGLVVEASDAATRLLELPKRRLRGKPVTAFVALEERRALRAALQRGSEASLELTLRPRSGRRVDALVDVRGLNGGNLVLLAPQRGGGAHRRLAGFEQLFERMGDGMLAVDRRGRIEYANGTARRLLGAVPGDVLPEEWSGFALGDFAASLFSRDAMHGEALVQLEGGRRQLRLIGMPSAERDAAVLVLVDATEREQWDQVQREFVANAAHELQTPLTAIAGAVEVLRTGGSDDPEARERFLAHLERETARMVRLVRSLLVLARDAQGEPVPFRPVLLRQLLDDVASRLEPHAGVVVEVLAPAELETTTNEELVERIVSNLADNAVKYTETGSVLLTARQRGTGAVIEVVDTGPGISDALRPRLAERFFRGSREGEGGFGLGLAIAHQAAEVIGGRLEFVRRHGGGTVARLVLEPSAR